MPDQDPQQGQQPQAWQSSGNPSADYRELMSIFQGGLAERRAGRNADAFVRQNMGDAEGNPQTMAHLAKLVAYVASKGGEPMGSGELAAASGARMGNRAGLGWPARTWSPQESQWMKNAGQQQPPGENASADIVGGLAPYSIAAASGNPFIAGTGSAVAGGVDAASDPNATKTSIGGSAAISGLVGMSGAAMLHGLAARMAPGAEPLEKMIELSGGSKALMARAAAEAAKTPGVPPLFAELNPRLMKAALRGASLTAPELQPQLIADATKALQEATAAKAAIGAKYEPLLGKPITDPAVHEILQRPIVQSFLKELHDAGMLPPDNQVTGRALNDLRMLMRQRSTALRSQILTVPDPVTIGSKKAIDGAADDLTSILSRNIPGFDALQREYGPYVQREIVRRQILQSLAGRNPQGGMPPGRGTGLVPPGETNIKGQLKYHLEQLPWQRKIKMVDQIAPLLLKPAHEAIPAAEELWPGFVSPLSRGAGPTAAMTGARGLLGPTPPDATQAQPQ